MTLSQIASEFAAQHFGRSSRVHLTALTGGLESPGVALAYVTKNGAPAGSFVAKPFTPATSREVDIYRALTGVGPQLGPTLLGCHYIGPGTGYMFLEWISAETRWPWSNSSASAQVLRRLAEVHASDVSRFTPALSGWDYESELTSSALSTVEVYRHAFLARVRPGDRPLLRSLERVVADLPRIRRELFAFTGTALLHGDAHPGNVVIRQTTTAGGTVFLDWARARIGSPLEDVSSWIHSLSVWEPEARRKHDTLLQAYSVARGSHGTLSRSFRDACILAGACNALAGALRYHLYVIQDDACSDSAKFDGYRAAADWLRIIRRADACFRA